MPDALLNLSTDPARDLATTEGRTGIAVVLALLGSPALTRRLTSSSPTA